MLNFLLVYINKIFKFFFLGLIFVSWFILNFILTLLRFIKWGFYVFFFWFLFVFKHNAFLKVLFFDLLFSSIKTAFLYVNSYFLRSFDVYYKFSVFIHFKWPLMKPLLGKLIDFVLRKIKVWCSFLFDKGVLLSWDTSYNISFLLYIYAFLFFYLFFFLTIASFCTLYFNIIFFAILLLLVYLICFFVYYFFINLLKYFLSDYISHFFIDFVYILNFFTGYLNTFWLSFLRINLNRQEKIGADFANRMVSKSRGGFTRIFKKHEVSSVLVSYISLFLMSVNLNSAKFITFFKRHGLFKTDLQHLPSYEEIFFRNLEYNATQLQEYHSTQDKFLAMSLEKPSNNFSLFKSIMIQRLLENFLRPTQFDMLLDTRNLLAKTKHPGSVPEFKYFWTLYKDTGMMSRSFDLIASTTWAQRVEHQLLRSRFYVEARYAYKSRHGRAPLLIYNFFRHGALPVQFWSTFYTKMKRARALGRKVDRAVQMTKAFPEMREQLVNIHYPVRVRKQEIPLKLSTKLERQQFFLNKRGMYTDEAVYSGKQTFKSRFPFFRKKGMQLKSHFSTIFRLISVDAPIIFSFLANLNYLILVLFGELFGDFFRKQVHYASNLYNIRFQIEQNILFNFRVRWFSKLFSFLFFDVWFYLIRSIIGFYFFARFRLFHANFLWYLLSKSFQILVFILQALKINDRSALSLFYVYFYKDFFKFKFNGKQSHKLFKKWGYIAMLIESFIFFFSFFIILFFDFASIWIRLLLRNKFFVYIYLFTKNFVFCFIRVFLIFFFNPFYYICLYCEDFDLETRRFKTQEHLNIYGKGPQVFEPIELFLVGFIFWKTLVKKYWWAVEIEDEEGIKRWPFFYKLSKKFPWFDRFLIFVYNFNLLFLYFYKLYLKSWLMNLRVYFKMFLHMKPYLFFKLLMFMIRMGLWLILYIYIYISYLHRKHQRRSFRRAEYSIDKPEIISFNGSYNRLKSLVLYSYNSVCNPTSANGHKRLFIPQNPKPTLKQSDLSFVVKTKTFYSAIKEYGYGGIFSKQTTIKPTSIDNFVSNELHKFKSQTAVNSLYSLYGYNQDFNGLVGRNIEEEIQTDLFRSKKVLWSNSMYKISNYICRNTNLVSVYGGYKKGCLLKFYGVYNNFFINDGLIRALNYSRRKNLKYVSGKLYQTKKRSRFLLLDRHFFHFFCNFFKSKLKLMHWKNNIRSHLTEIQYKELSCAFASRTQQEQYSLLSNILFKSHETKLNNLKEFFKKRHEMDSFLSLLKNNPLKTELFGKSSYDNCEDFVTFYHNFSRFSYTNIFPVDLKFKLSWFWVSKPKSLYNSIDFDALRKYRGDIRDAWVSSIKQFLPINLIIYEWRKTSLIFINYVGYLLTNCWKISLYRGKAKGKRIIRIIRFMRAIAAWILEKVFHIYQDPVILDKKYNIGTTTIFDVDEKINIEAKSKTYKKENDHSCYEDEQQSSTTVSYLAAYVLQFELEMKFLTNPFLRKKTKILFEKFVWFYCEFLLGFANLLQTHNKSSWLSFLFSGIFFFIWQATIIRSIWMKTIYSFWGCFSQEVFFFYSTFLYTHAFRHRLNVNEIWLGFISDVFSLSLCRYFEESLKEGSFLRRIPAEEYKWRGDVAQSLELHKKVVDEFMDLILRREVSAVKFKKKGELISDHELFWRNFLRQEKGFSTEDHILTQVFQVRGNIIARSRAYAIHRFLHIAANLRFYYHKVFLGYDRKQRANVFLQEYPEFKDFFGDQKDIHYWRRNYDTREKRKQAKIKRGFYMQKSFLNILPDLWFFGKKILKLKLWREHFFLKFWVWFSATSNFRTNVYFLVFGVIVLGLGFLNILSFNGLAALFSMLVSYIVFMFGILYWLIESAAYQLLGFSWPMLREISELFFYNFVLYPDLQSVLMSLGLYDVFLFLMNNFVLYEADIFVKQRIALIFITTAWVFVHTVLFHLITLTLLFLNVFLHDLYLIDFFVLINQTFLQWFSFELAFQTSPLDLKYNVLMFVHFYLLFMYNIVFKIVPSVFWQFLFFLEYGWGYFWLQLLNLSMSHFWFKQIGAWLSWKLVILCFPEEFVSNLMLLYKDAEFFALDILWRVVIRISPFFHIADETFAIYCWWTGEFNLNTAPKYDVVRRYILPLQRSDFLLSTYWDIDTFVFLRLISIYKVYCIIKNIVILLVHIPLILLVEILIKILDIFIFIDFTITFILNFFLTDLIFSDLVVFIFHCIIWVYLNLIYYLILIPFMKLLFGLFFIGKFLLLLPIKLWVFSKTLVFFFFSIFEYLFSILQGLIHFISLVELIFKPIFNLVVDYNMLDMPINLANFIAGFLVFPFKLLWKLFLTFFELCSSVLLLNHLLNIIWDLLDEFWYLFYLLIKEILSLFFLIFKLMFRFLAESFSSFGLFFWFLVEIIDALFPSLKYIFNPIGGVSVFYATFYYYLFVFTCYIWSLSFRAFNDTTREPPLPTEVWPEVVAELEDHPIIKRLPFDVYQLLYSEKLCTRKGLPDKLDQSLRSWLPSKTQPNLARLTQVKTTPLNAQGYYYMLLNGLTKKAVKAYYKARKLAFVTAWEKSYRTLGVKEFFHFLRDLPLDILDATSEFLRFEWKTDKPIFERDAKKTLGEKLNLPIIIESFELIFPKDIQHIRKRDAQIFEQLLAERFGNGQADEIIWSFPVLGKIFNVRSVEGQQEHFKLEIVKAGWKYGFNPDITPTQREIKKKLVLHWLLKSRDFGFTLRSFQEKKWKENQSSLIYSLDANIPPSMYERWDFEDEMGGASGLLSSETRQKRILEEYIEKNLESFHIKRYEKIAVITDRDGETLADPLFLAVRALDLFLYPVLVFATINTGWWYGSNGIMDAAMRYVKLEEYAAEMAEVFEHDMDMDALFSDKERLIRRIGSDAVSNMILFDSKEAVDLFFPTQRTVDWFWEKFAKQHPELDANFSLFLEQDPYYFLETAASHITHPEDTRGLGREPWGTHIYGFWQDKYQDVIYKFKRPMDLELENLSSDLESILDSMQLIRNDVLNRDKHPYNLYKDYKLTKTDKQYDFKLKWREFLTSMEEEGLDVYEKRRLEFLSDVYNEDFLGYALYIASDFDLKRYDMSGAYFFADWHNKREVLDYDLTADDEVAKLKRLYDKVTADQAKQQLDRNVAALKKLAKDEGFETETEVGRRMLLQYALDYNLVRFDIEDEDQKRYAKILQEGGGDQFTDEELEQMEEKARERFHSIFLEVFTAFDAPDKEEEEMSVRLKTQREEKLKWFYDQLKRFKPAKHPLNEKEAIDDLLFVYHNFQRDPGYWFWTNPLLYKGFFSFFKDSFYSLDRRSLYVNVYNQNPTTWLMKPIKDMTDYYFIDEYVNPTVQFHPRLLHYVDQKSIPITRANPYPYGHDFLKTIEHRYNITRPYSKTQEFLDLLRESEISIYEAKGWDPRFTAKFHVDVDLFREEVLFGEIFYKFYTSGFASLFENDTLKWLLWGFYKLYEGTLLGDVIHKFFDSLFANSLMFGPSIMPVIITELDPETRMALFDRFGHGDLAPFRWDFYNAYTGFTFYNHNEEIYSKRNALFYFSHPEYFSDVWFLQNITSNPFIGITILSEHMKNASYERKSIFHSSEMNIQLTSFFKRYMSEEIKMVIRFGLYLWLYTTEFTDILREYFSTYILFRAFYDLVITPLVLFYNASKSIYFILNEIGARIYQIYAYLIINLKILETFAHISIAFVLQPLKHFSLFVSEVFIWGINRILASYKTEFLTDLGFDVWWKRTLIRHVFLYLGPSFEFISLSFLNNPTKILSLFKKRFLEYTSFFWNIEKMVALLKDPWAGRRSVDLQLPWIAGIAWAGIGVGHSFGTHNLFRRMLLEHTYLWFLMDHWFKLNLTSVIFSIYNLSNWDYSSLQLLWKIISPHNFFSKVHIYAPWAFNEFIIVVCDKLDDHMPVYENIEWFLEKWTANAYNVVGLDMRALGKWQPNSFDDSYSQWIFVFSLADLEGLHKAHKDYFGFFGTADYRSSQTNKPFIKLRNTEGMPFMLRESVEAPYSIAISDGLIILNKAEQQFLSRRAINKVFSNEHFFAFDFLTAYNESYLKSDSAFKVTMRQAFSDLRFWNAYGFLQPMSDISLRPAFTFDVSSNFYSNMRVYEQELGIQKLRYFFHRYQWLMQDVFPYKNDMTKLSDLFVEMVLERGIFDVMHMRFSNTKQAPELLDHKNIREETAILRVSVDIYGNLVYSLEGPEWFINPEPTETDIFLNNLLYPALDNYAGFMINKVFPATKNSLFYIGGKISQFEKWLFPRRVGPSKEWIKIRVHFAEEAGHINPRYVYSLGGTIRYDVEEIMGKDWISPGLRKRMQQEELEAKKKQEELDKMKQEIHAEWGLSEEGRGTEKTEQFTGWDSFEENISVFSSSESDSPDISGEEPEMLTLDQIIGPDLPTHASEHTPIEISANISTDIANSMVSESEVKDKEPKTRMRITRIEPDPEYTIRIYFENVPETEIDEVNVEGERGNIEGDIESEEK